MFELKNANTHKGHQQLTKLKTQLFSHTHAYLCINTHPPFKKSNTLCYIACSEIILTDRLGKETWSQVKEEVSDSRHRKARGKQYGNGHIDLNISYFCACWLKQNKHWTSDFKKAVYCKVKSPTDLHRQDAAFPMWWCGDIRFIVNS